MRLAAILARVAARDITTTSVGALFHAATVGGAEALGRPDLGRLAAGAKADLVLVDLANPWMRPARDPLRSLVFTAADRAVRTVFVHGTKVMEHGRVLTMDHEAALGGGGGGAAAHAARRAVTRLGGTDGGPDFAAEPAHAGMRPGTILLLFSSQLK